MKKSTFIPFWKYGKWAISIDPVSMIVHACSDWGKSGTIVYKAKSVKQAWFAYHNPEKVSGLLKDNHC